MTPHPTSAELLAWLDDAARYFEARDTKGEDQAHWANVFNAEMCRKIKAHLALRPAAPVAVKALEWKPSIDEYWLRAEATGQVHEVTTTDPDREKKQAAAQADYEQRIKAALVSVPAAPEPVTVEWHAVDSAPKDGTPFLALEDEERGPFKCWMHTGFSPDEYYWMDHQDSEPSPRHWMPLPAPPAVDRIYSKKEG